MIVQLVVVALVLLTPLSRAEAQQPADTATAGLVARAVESLFSAVERGDLAALDTLYAGEALTVIEGAGINRGWADYRDRHLVPELKEFAGFQYRVSEIEPRVAGNTAWAIFRYTIKATRGERVIDQVGRGTAVLQRRGNRWVVVHTHTSSRPRRPSDPA